MRLTASSAARARLARFAIDSLASAGVAFALTVTPVVLFVGAAIDYSRFVRSRTELQQAVDSAVLAGIRAAAAQRTTVATSLLTGATTQAGFSSLSATWANNADGSFTGAATGSLKLLFGSALGLSSATIGATATAVAASGAASPTRVCALVLDPTASQALLVNSNVTINAPSCEIDVASTAAPAAIFNSGDTFNLAKICVAGANVIQNGGAVGPLQTGCATAADPFAGALPTVAAGACSVSNQNYAGSVTLSPGVYCGAFNFNGSGNLNLQPGLYVFKGVNWNLNSTWTVAGTGVTFYFADQNSYIQVNSGVTMNVSAPTSGAYANILMFEPAGLPKSSFTINGSAGHQLNGLIYLPSRIITFNAQSNLTAENIMLVVNQLILDTLTWNVAPAPLSPTPAGASKVSAARLTK